MRFEWNFDFVMRISALGYITRDHLPVVENQGIVPLILLQKSLIISLS